jgi:hypothetical protein
VAGDIAVPRRKPRAREDAAADDAGADAAPTVRTPPPDDDPIPY